MSIHDTVMRITKKRTLFEYFVICLYKWRKELVSNDSAFTKLQLQKLLFLASSLNATMESHYMLDIFNKFYALRYGPVEMDVYDAMQSNSFTHINFVGNDCLLKNGISELSIAKEDQLIIDNAILNLRQKNEKYVLYSPFQLVDITHGWTVWQISMAVADLCGSKKERMRTEDIICSTIKTF